MAKSSEIYVVKHNGERELFSEDKVIRSMNRVGLDSSVQPKVLALIKERLHPEMETAEIFSHIKEYLDNHQEHKASIRFNLKQSIFDLGPTGFPFERYMQRIFQEMGYKSEVNLILQGACVTHEIDVMVEKDGKKEVIEAKFHNQQGVKTDVQVLLYTYARFLDCKETNQIDGVWVVTNTKLTGDASNYARCKGVKVIGWNYPETNNLQDFVEKPQLYPITILTALSREEKQSLLTGNIILCSDFIQTSDSELKDTYFLSQETINTAKDNARMLMHVPEDHQIPAAQI